ncbi:MAG TPA: hypothetical protein VKV25_08365 [Acidimicrobiales bacterium]|nr:hypothetical protein [Acidimicrobiales bacterium]
MGVAAEGWRRELAAGLAARLAARLPSDRRTGGSRIVAVDGWSGSGKTSLAAWLAPALGAPCVALEDLVAGWHGLARSVRLGAEQVTAPLAAGRPARWRRWDWSAGAWGEEAVLEPAPVVVLEGCGAASAPVRPYLAASVWLDVEEGERVRRLRARPDWAGYEPWADAWAAQEAALRCADDPVAVSDVVVVDRPPVVRLRWRASPPQ